MVTEPSASFARSLRINPRRAFFGIFITLKPVGGKVWLKGLGVFGNSCQFNSFFYFYGNMGRLEMVVNGSAH